MADVLRFDIAKDPKGNPITYGRVGDTDGLTRSVKVFEDGKPLDLTGYVITFEGNTSKYRTKVFDTGGVELVDATKGEFTYTFPNMAFAVEGQYERAYFSFASAERRMTTGDFEIIVFGNSDIDAAEAETIITEYNRLVAELHALQEQAIDDMNGKFEDLETDISNLGNQLIDIQNEIDRVFEEFKSGNFWTKEESFNKEESSANVIYQLIGKDKVRMTLSSDFQGKVAGSLIENANIASSKAGSSLFSPDDFVPDNYVNYSNLSTLGGGTLNSVNQVQNNMIQLLIQYDIVDIITKNLNENFWLSQGATNKKEKASVARSIVKSLEGSVWGWGSSGNGSKLSLSRASYINDSFNSWSVPATNQNGSIAQIKNTLITSGQIDTAINGNGIFNQIVYADPSDGITGSSSTIDYTRVDITIELSMNEFIRSMIAAYYVGAIATQSESETGTDNTKTMTPLRTKQQIDKRMATQSEAEAGTDSSKLMTPFATKQNIDKRIANQEEAEAGIADDKLMTPSTMNSFYLAKTQKRRQRWDEGLNWVAHRGNNTTYPENTIPAFLATKRHFGIETDIQVTSDGKWVVMHDATVDRTTNGTGAIASMTLAQFRALRIDTGSNLAVCTDAELTPPTLEEYLIACKTVNKVPVIEIKSYAYTDAHYTLLKDTLTRFGYDESNCVVISFDYAVLTKMRALYPNMELQYLVNSITSENINQAITLGVPGAISCSYSNASVTEANIKLIHAAGLKVAVWTVPDASFDKMIKLGVDYITTNSKSGNLRYGKLTFANGFTSNPDGGRVDSNYVEEINGTNLRVEFNVSDGVSTQNSAIATFPDWAIPMYRQFAQCGIRTSGGVSIATFDINGRLVPSAGTPGTIAVGLNWADRTSWAAGSTTYKLD